MAICLSFVGKLSELIRSIPVPVMGGVCILLFGVIAASGIRVLVESKVDYSKSANLVMSSVIMIVGLSGAKLTFGTISVQGMVLATLVAILMSLTFKLLDSLGLMRKINKKILTFLGKDFLSLPSTHSINGLPYLLFLQL